MKFCKFVSCPNFIEGYQNLSQSIQGETVTGWFINCSNGYILSIWDKFVHFALPLNLAIYRVGNSPNSLCPRLQMSFIPILYSIVRCIKLPYISELVNRNYNFKTLFKISLKAIIMETSSQFYDGVYLQIPLLSYKCFSDITYVEGKPFMKMNMSLMNFQILSAILLFYQQNQIYCYRNRLKRLFFQDLEFQPKQQWQPYYTVQLANSHHLQNASE